MNLDKIVLCFIHKSPNEIAACQCPNHAKCVEFLLLVGEKFIDVDKTLAEQVEV